MAKRVISVVLNNFTNDSRVLKEARSITGMGNAVQVVALHDEGLLEHEECSGFHVHRIKLITRSIGKNPFFQFFKYLEFLFKVIALYRRADIVHSHDLNALPIGWTIKLIALGKVKLVYDAHEFAINDHPFESKAKQFLKKVVESFFIYYVDHIITVSDGISILYQKTYGLRVKPSVVLNCPYPAKRPTSNMLKQKLNIRKDTYTFLYQGAMSEGRGIQHLINEFKKIDDDSALVFMGYGELVPTIKAQGNDRIFFLPAVPPEEILDYTASADCGVALIEDSCLSYRYCLPNKLFEYFMAGLPVIASDLPEMAKLVNQFDVGALCSIDKKTGFRHAVESVKSIDKAKLASNLQKLSREYNWKNQEVILQDIYNAL